MDIVYIIITTLAFIFFAYQLYVRFKKVKFKTYKHLKDLFRRYFSMAFIGAVLALVIIPKLAINKYIGLYEEFSHNVVLQNLSSETQYYIFKQKLDTTRFWRLSPHISTLSHRYIVRLDSGEIRELSIGNYSVPITQTIIENISDTSQTDSTVLAAAFLNTGSKLFCKQSDMKPNFTKQNVNYASILIEIYIIITAMLGALLFAMKGKKLWQKIIINLSVFLLLALSSWLLIDKVRILLYYYFGVLI